MPNSYGFQGDIPGGAIAGLYDTSNGEWTGAFYFTEADAQRAKDEIDDAAYSVKAVNNSEWVGSEEQPAP